MSIEMLTAVAPPARPLEGDVEAGPGGTASAAREERKPEGEEFPGTGGTSRGSDLARRGDYHWFGRQG
jgi:hypothetical protein